MKSETLSLSPENLYCIKEIFAAHVSLHTVPLSLPMEEPETTPLVPSRELSAFFDVNAPAMISAVTHSTSQPSPLNPGSHPTYPIQLVPVHTFIIQGHTKDVPLRGVLVPSFASHWAVVVGKPKQYTLYHLVFKTGQDTGNREVEFHHVRWNEPNDNTTNSATTITEVGKTRYSHIQLVEIGAIPRSVSIFASN